jgi:hypothetical protein
MAQRYSLGQLHAYAEGGRERVVKDVCERKTMLEAGVKALRQGRLLAAFDACVPLLATDSDDEEENAQEAWRMLQRIIGRGPLGDYVLESRLRHMHQALVGARLRMLELSRALLRAHCSSSALLLPASLWEIVIWYAIDPDLLSAQHVDGNPSSQINTEAAINDDKGDEDVCTLPFDY